MNRAWLEAREFREEAAERELTAGGPRSAGSEVLVLAALERALSAGSEVPAPGAECPVAPPRQEPVRECTRVLARAVGDGHRIKDVERRVETMNGNLMRALRPGSHRRSRAPLLLRRVVAHLWLAAVVVALLGFGVTQTVQAETITLLHVNDSHSHLDAWGPKDENLDGTVGGMAKAATIIEDTRAREPNVLLLHAGDVFHGDLFFNAYFGVPEFQLMQQLHFDAMAVGNHEFDLGPDVLAYALANAYPTAKLPLLSVNLDLADYPALTTWIQSTVIREVGGVKIGIFGMTNPDDPMNMPAPVKILGAFPDTETLFGIAWLASAGLRGAGADIVICLSHLGLAYDQALAANVPGIDLIVGGHDHYVFATPVAVANPEGKPVLILQAGNHYRYVGRLRFDVEAGAVRVQDYAMLEVDRKVAPLPDVQGVVDGLKAGVEALYGDVYHLELARAVSDLETTTKPKAPWRDSAMGNLITDAQRAATGTDIAMTANGLISEGIPKGPIVGVDLFRPVSYGYDVHTGLGLHLATFDITGLQLVMALETTLAYGEANEDFLPQLSGMSFAYDPSAPVGARVLLDSVRIGGEPLEVFASYSATVNEVVATLLPMMGVEVTNVQLLDTPECTALESFVAGLHTVNYRSEGRIVDIGRLEPGDEGVLRLR